MPGGKAGKQYKKLKKFVKKTLSHQGSRAVVARGSHYGGVRGGAGMHEVKFSDAILCSLYPPAAGGPTSPVGGNTGAVAPDNTNNLLLLNGTTPGAGANQRIGNKIRLRSVRVRASFVVNGTGAPDVYRLIIFYDRQPAKSYPALGDLLLSVPAVGAAGSSVSVSTPLNMNYRERFKVLRDKLFQVPGTTAGSPPATTAMWSVGADPLLYDEYIDLKKFQFDTVYEGTTGCYADITTGSLWILAIHQNSTATTTLPYRVLVDSRLRFDDW